MRTHAITAGANSWSAATAGDAYQEDVTYDGNGNILTYLRNGSKANNKNKAMDNLTYGYQRDAAGNLLSNKLLQVKDAVTNSEYANDLRSQNDGNYVYDNIGNLVKDNQAGISNIAWTVYGKIKSITNSLNNTSLEYQYDGAGNRTYKGYTHDGLTDKTWYVRDAQGNVLAVYGNKNGDNGIYWKEQDLYGSDRLGVWSPDIAVTDNSAGSLWDMAGKKRYELSNHLGNVMSTIGDYLGSDNKAVVFSAQDYYPFGMAQVDRTFNLGEYRYGFNGQEHSSEVGGNNYTARFWEYDSRIGRRWNLDPKPTVGVSEYSAFRNGPIWVIDPLGDTTIVNNTGRIISNDKIGNSVYVHHFKDNTNSYIGEIGGKIDANEIFKNLLDKNITISKGLVSPWTFRNLVKNKGAWDLKKNTGTIYGLANAFDKGKDNKTQFSFQGELYTAPDLGNYHYGATGKAFYLFSEHTLLSEAGKAQLAAGTSKPEWQHYRIQVHNAGRGEQYEEKIPLPPYGDDPQDQDMIKRGFRYYIIDYNKSKKD